jgi:transposase
VECRALGRLYLDLLEDRNAWAQRAHATLFHHGTPPADGDLSTPAHQQRVVELAADLPAVNRHAIEVAIAQIRQLSGELAEVHRQLVWIGQHQPAARAMQAIYGVGRLVAPIVWAELGDVRRFSSSRQAVDPVPG